MMKKRLNILVAMVFLFTVFSIGASAAYSYTGLEADVDGTGENFDSSTSSDSEIGTDFYIVDYQDSVLTYQLKVQIPMYVSLAVVADGEVAVPSTTAYGFRNFSAYPVDITAVDVSDPAGSWTLVTTPSGSKDLSVSLEGKNLLALDGGSETLTQIPAATTLDGQYKAYAITASAFPSTATATSGYQFRVSYTLALDKS